MISLPQATGEIYDRIQVYLDHRVTHQRRLLLAMQAINDTATELSLSILSAATPDDILVINNKIQKLNERFAVFRECACVLNDDIIESLKLSQEANKDLMAEAEKIKAFCEETLEKMGDE